MTTKTTGKEFKQFWEDPEFWPADGETYVEEELITVNGVEQESFDHNTVSDVDILAVSGGMVFSPVVGPEDQSLESYFKRWRKKQATATLVVECDITKRDELAALIKSNGGKVV